MIIIVIKGEYNGLSVLILGKDYETLSERQQRTRKSQINNPSF